MMELRLSGSGGQGLILAGIILAEAAIFDGKEAVQSQSYGPEARGGSSKSEVIINERVIHYPKVTKPNLFLAMTQEAFNKFSNDLDDDSIVVIDEAFVKQAPQGGYKVYSVPITNLAREKCGRELVANVVALGAIVKLTNVVTLESLERALLARVPKGTEDLNRLALETGYNAV